MIYIPRYYVYMEIDFARRLCRNMQGGTWRLKNRIIDTDVLIIGGGTAGCFAGITLGKKKDLDVLIVEKANIVRSGCLAAGVNAINAYITKGRVPQDYVDYCKKDADGIVREDLLLSMSERLNHVTKVMEDLGLVILKDGNGDYVARGNRNIKINGENIKPILADAVKKQDNVAVINHLNITDFIVENNKIKGAYGFDVNNAEFYEINAKAVLVATGGAAGLYRPNNPGFSRHKMWYPPFNTGAGYAMVGVERNMDIFGVSVLGVATAVGGGMIRDVVLGVIPPAVFTNPVYALVSVLTSCIVFFIFYFKRELLQGHRRETYDKIMLAMDSVGLGIFTVVGVNAGIRQGYMDNAFLLVFLGTITGVGGGLLRDMMASVPPYIFVKHIYACASIIGAIVPAISIINVMID